MAEFLNFKGDYKGLTEEKAQKHLSMYGENLFHETEDKSFKSYHSVLNPWGIILLLAGAAELALQSYITAAVCFALAIASAAAIATLCRSCNMQTAQITSKARMKYRVIRDGRLVLLPACYIVPDDVIIVQNGETVPADAHILEENGVLADESRFTGDNTPMPKHPGSDSSNMTLKASCIYAGTRIVGGGAVARVIATGEDTYRVRSDEKKGGKLPDPDYSEYERVISRLRFPLIAVSAVICIFGVVYSLLTGMAVSAGIIAVKASGWLICLIPPFAELFIRLYNIHSAKRIEQKGAAIKNLGVMEKLNALTAVVLDKSAVVAPNMLEVAGIYSKNSSLMTTVTVLSGDADNPSLTEQAFILNAALAGADIKQIRSNELIRSFPYNDDDRIGGNLYKVGGDYLLCVKGSVERITGLCEMGTDTLFDIQHRSAGLSEKGFEVWASAYAIIDREDELPKSLYSVKYTYMGMTSFMSAIRDMIPLAVQGCRRAGVRLVLMSSDSPETAASMGRKIGLNADNMITGDEVSEALISGEQPDYSSAEIFSNVTSARKPAIIEGMKNSGEIVAVYGRSDTDYEMLCRSDLGITSLENTTGCIYENSGLIVAEDSFGGIVEIIREARQLHRNIKKCLSLFLSALTAAAVLVLADIIFSLGAFSPMSAALTVLAVLPVCAASFIDNTADLSGEMSSSGFIGRGKINKGFFTSAIFYGAVTGIICSVCAVVCGGILPPAQVCSLVFIMLTADFCTAAAVTAGGSVRTIGGAVTGKTLAALSAVLISALLLTYIPFLNISAGFEAPNPAAASAALICGASAGIGYEIKKLINKI